MKPLTLQGRIITLLTLFTIVTITTFVVIQLAHELKVMNKYKKSEALIVSLAVENIWEKVSNLKIPSEMKAIFLQRKLNSLEKSKAISKAYVLDSYGKIVSSTSSRDIGKSGDPNDLETINRVTRDYEIKNETIIDEKNKTFSLYISLRQEEKVDFVVRVFFSLTDLSAALVNVYKPAMIIGVCIIMVNVVLGIFLSQIIVGPVKIFNAAAGKIASGRLDLRINLTTSDELEELADSFNIMTTELLRMKELAENANPLTKLPGNIVIAEKVESRIKEGRKFTVIYCDLDNFKAFNDKYGIHKGDEAISMTGEIFKEIISKDGQGDDFVGHEGGDDFLIIVEPEKAQEVAKQIIAEFDKRVRFLYSKEDVDRGHIVAHARDGSIKTFPIMSISLAGVTNVNREIKSYGEVTNIAAEIKKKAKAFDRSCFVIDARRGV